MFSLEIIHVTGVGVRVILCFWNKFKMRGAKKKRKKLTRRFVTDFIIPLAFFRLKSAKPFNVMQVYTCRQWRRTPNRN